MESKNENGDDHKLAIEQINKNMKKKKPSRGMHMFSVVMFMLRRRRRRTPVNNSFWRRVVDPGQKVNSKNTIMPPPSDSIHKAILPQVPPLAPAIVTGGDGGGDDDDNGEKTSEVVPASSASISSGISGYGSAMSLRDLDYHYDDEEDECYSDVEGGDDKIDEKAEEFIVKFYEQMKIQNQAYSNRCKAKRLMI